MCRLGNGGCMIAAAKHKPRRAADSAGTSADECEFWQALVAEAFGAFLLTLVIAMPIVVDALTGKLQNIDKVAPAGMVVAAMIYTLGNVSGAHFNPAVTLAFAVST